MKNINNKPLNIKDVAELCGIILGDGNLHKHANRITITGSLKDKEYHRKHVSELFVHNFHINPIFFEQKSKNAHYIQIESKEMMGFFLAKGLSRGQKINPKIPSFIFDRDDLIVCFLRGLFDTDGNIKFSRLYKDKNFYPRIRICAKKSEMARDIAILLKRLNFNHGVWRDKRTKNTIFNYEISGKENTLRWFNLIQPKNPNHVKKYDVWLRYGYYKKELSLNIKERIFTNP